MQRIFGARKEKVPPPSLTDQSGKINARGEGLDERIRKLDADLVKHREQIKKTRPGPAQEALKARAMRVLKQRKLLEGQRETLYNQAFNLEQVSFAQEGIKDAQATVTAMKVASKDLKSTMKTFKIEHVEALQDDMMDYVDYASEIQDALGQSYGVPDDIDEDDLMGELDALEADMGSELESDGAIPSYLQPDVSEGPEPKELADLQLPAAPAGSIRVADSAAREEPQAAARPLRM